MKHINQAGGIVVDGSGQALMVLALSGKWTFPKGKVEPGESLQAAARREIEEETGVHELRFIKALGSYERPGFTRENLSEPSVIKHITFFLFRTAQQKLVVRDQGTLGAEWVAIGHVAERLSYKKDRIFFLEVQPTIKSLVANWDAS